MTPLLTATDLALPGRLFDVSLNLERGKLACLIGPNGSGKTSLLHAIAGIGRPIGTARIDQVDPRAVDPAHRVQLVTFLPASREIAWPLLASDLIALGGATPAQAAAIIERLELETVANRRVDRLSTGERNRVMIARALAPEPSLLLLDEPTANLDLLWQIRLMDLIREQVGQRDRAALVAIHDLDAAGRFADRLFVMAGGRVAAEGSPAEILAGHWVPQIFGVERHKGEWRPAMPADRQSSR